MIFQSRISQIQDEISAVGSDVDALRVLSGFSLFFFLFFWHCGWTESRMSLSLTPYLFLSNEPHRMENFAWILQKNKEGAARYRIYNLIYNLVAFVWNLNSSPFLLKNLASYRDEFISQMLELNAKIRLASLIKIMMV